MEEIKKQILLINLANYNETVNNISKFKLNTKEINLFCDIMQQFAEKYHTEQLRIGGVVSSLTAKDKLYLNTLLVNKLLEKEPDGTYKAVNDLELMDRVNDLMEKVNNS